MCAIIAEKEKNTPLKFIFCYLLFCPTLLLAMVTFGPTCSVVLERPYWTNEKVLSAMQNLSLADVLNFANTTLLRDVLVSCLAHGNVDATTVSLGGRKGREQAFRGGGRVEGRVLSREGEYTFGTCQ